MGAGMELAKAFVTVRGDLSQLAGDLESAQTITNTALASAGALGDMTGQIDATSSASGGLATNLTAVSTAMDSMDATTMAATRSSLALQASLAGMAFAIGHYLKKALHQGSDVWDTFETIKTEIEQMTGSVDVAAGMLERFEKFSEKAGMSVPQIWQMSRAFVQSGKSGQQVVDLLQLMGDASGGTTEKFKVLAKQFQRMENGANFNRVFNVLSSQGIVTMKDMEKYTGRSEKAIRKMMRDGKIDTAEFTKILHSLADEGGRNYKALEKQAQAGQRLSDSFHNAENKMVRMLYMPLDPYFDALTVAMTRLSLALANFFELGGEYTSFMAIGAAGTMLLTSAVIGLVAAVSTLYTVSLPALTAAATAAFGVGAAVPGVLEFAVGIVAIVVAMAALGAALGALVRLFHIPEMLSAVWNYMYSVIERSWDGLSYVFNNFLDIWDRMFGVVSAAIDAIMLILGDYFGWIGTSLDDLLMSWIGVHLDMMKSFTDFVLDVLEWGIVLIEHWEFIWEALPQFTTLAMLRVKDIFSNAALMLLDVWKSAMAMLISTVAFAMAEIAILLAQTAMGPMFTDGMAKKIRETAQLAADAANEAAGTKTGPTDLFAMSDETKDFLDNFEALFGNIGEKIFGRKEELEKGRRNNKGIPDGAAAPDKEEKGIKDKSGIYGIGDFGKHIQQAMLEKEDKVAAAVGIGNGIQQKVLDELVMLNQQNFGLA